MKVIYTILGIRLRQLLRLIRTLGWGYLLILLPLVLLFVLVILEQAQKLPGLLGVAGLILLTFIHVQRNDKAFLSSLECAPFLFRATEYSAGVLPLTALALGVLGSWEDGLLLQGGALLVALLPMRQKRAVFVQPSLQLSFLPVQAYEWKAGFRRYGWGLLLLYLVGLTLCWLVGTIPIVAALMAVVVSSFYEDIEAKEMLESVTQKGDLLKHKLRMQVQIFHGGMLPLYVLFLIFHAAYWYILLLATIGAQLLLSFAVFYKYANYSPGRRRVYNQLVVGLFFMSLLLPFLLPVAGVYCLVYSRRASRNLNYYYA